MLQYGPFRNAKRAVSFACTGRPGLPYGPFGRLGAGRGVCASIFFTLLLLVFRDGLLAWPFLAQWILSGRQPPRYSLGVIPKLSLNAAEKYFTEWKPVRRAMSARLSCVSFSSRRATPMRMLLM